MTKQKTKPRETPESTAIQVVRTNRKAGLTLVFAVAAAAACASSSPEIRYTLTETGTVVIVVNDEAGRRVRNLIAEAERGPGEHVETWDGRDDSGRLVPPADYRFSGAVTPPLSLRYEFTLNNAGTVPWWRNVDNGNPMREKGGWMSDHSPPNDVAAWSNLVFLAADATEHGNSLNVIDLDGKQVWATRWFGLAGARFVATDDRWAYAAAEGAWIGNNFKLFVLSPRTFEFRELAGFNFDTPKDGRSGGLSGLAARDGKVAVAFNGTLIDGMAGAIRGVDPAATTLCGLQAAQANGVLRAVEPSQPWINWPLPQGTNTVLRLAWGEARTVGAILSPHRLEVATLRAEAAYPGNVDANSEWEPLVQGAAGTALRVYTAPGGRSTRALRVRVLDAVPPRAWAEPQRPPARSDAAPTHFLGLRIVPLAVRDVGTGATFAAGAGTVTPDGTWENVQTSDITPAEPAVYTLQLPRSVAARALVVRDPFFVAADVEVQAEVGAAWTRLGQMKATLPWRRAYTEATFDFHRDVRVSAVRLSVTQPATAQNPDAKKRTGARANVCSLGGVVLLGGGAGDPPIPPDWGQRIAIYNADEGRLLQEIPVAAPGALEFAPDGRLLAISGTQVVHVPLDGNPPQAVVAQGLLAPRGLAIDADGRLYVSDAGDHVVKRVTPDGRRDLVIGKPGGLDVGPYDPAHMSRPTGLALDARGRLWVAEHEHRPKKVSVWSLTGVAPKLETYYIGGAPYGGAFMYPDPRNPSRFFFQGMEFAANWETGESRITNIVWRGGRGLSWGGVTTDRPIYCRDRLYLVGEPHSFYGNGYFAVAQYDAARGQAIPVAAAGVAERWPPLRDPEVRKALGEPTLDRVAFAWSDTNGNERVDADEIELNSDMLEAVKHWTWDLHAGRDLALQFGGLCLVPVKFVGKGVPVYAFDHTRPSPPSAGPPTLPYGKNYHGMGVTRDDRIIELSSVVSVHPRAGDPLWTYPAPWPGTQMSGKASSPRPGLVVGQLGVIGGAVLSDVGEIFAFVADKGEIYVFTTDGLFVARLFRDKRYGKSWNFPEARRGMEVGGVSINGEHFGGTFTQMEDGRILLVVGHNHSSVVRVDGLDRIRRFSGTVRWDAAQYLCAEQALVGAAATKTESLALNVHRAPAGIALNGILDDWPATAFVDVEGAGSHAGRMAMAWDPQRLLLAYAVRGRPALQNGGDDWTLLFKSGDSVDLQFGTNPQADPQRSEPAPGDLRLSLSLFEGKPVAVLYRYRVPGAPERDRRTFASPVGSVAVDIVERIAADVRVVSAGDGYTVEAAIPWSSLHCKPPSAGAAWHGDLGILFASEGGGGVSERLYWSNRDTGLVVDVPGEIRLRPAAWGTLRFE